jgi:hypothetical protein
LRNDVFFVNIQPYQKHKEKGKQDLYTHASADFKNYLIKHEQGHEQQCHPILSFAYVGENAKK